MSAASARRRRHAAAGAGDRRRRSRPRPPRHPRRTDRPRPGRTLTFRGRQKLADRIPPGVRPAVPRSPPASYAPCGCTATCRVERWTGPVDVVHATFIGPPARSPVVVTIHDLTFIRFPELCTRDTLQYGRLVRRALDRGATVHATSEFVAGEVREHFAIDDTRIVQIPLGVGPSAGGDPDRDARSPGRRRYVLALGTVEPRKNLPVLVRAFDQMAPSDPELRLVVAGADGWGASEFQAAGRRRSTPTAPCGSGT